MTILDYMRRRSVAKRSARKQSRKDLRQESSVRYRRAFVLAYSLCALLLAVDAYAAFQYFRSKNRGTIPGHLVGRWETSAPKYAGRALEITGTSIAFHTGVGAQTYGIDRVKHRRVEGIGSYTIEYGSLGEVLTFSFEVTRDPDLALRVENQEGAVWRKVATE